MGHTCYGQAGRRLSLTLEMLTCHVQVALEIHDIDGGLHRATELLRITAGFDTVVAEQDPQLRGSTLYTVFCTRADPF